MRSRSVALLRFAVRVFAALSAAVLAATDALAQDRGAAQLGSLVEGLGISARVLVIAAHPDDEDTQLIAWLARGQHVETAYLSLTRGDGGQNLIGNELGEALGAIRTEELLSARRLDGGRQYFTRAYDYGFSKNSDEAFAQWPHDSLLRDVVTVVRAFKPHVIVSVFSGTPRDGHGQHQAAGILAKEAYEVAADSVRLPRAATAGHAPWTVAKFYRGAFFRGDEATLRMNVGEYDPLLGRSYSEIAAVSRSQHKSQAMGQLQRKGPRMDALIREATRAAAAPNDAKQERGLFDGLDTSWARFRPVVSTPERRAALDSLGPAFGEVRTRIDVFHPSMVLPALARAAQLLVRVCDVRAEDETPSCEGTADGAAAGSNAELRDDMVRTATVATQRLNDAIIAAAGVAVEATANREVWAVGQPVTAQVTVYNRGDRPMRVSGVTAILPGAAPRAAAFTATLLPDSSAQDSITFTAGSVTQPWWLVTARRAAMFVPEVRGIPEDVATRGTQVDVEVVIESVPVHAVVPLVYRYADPIRGEVNRPLAAAPAIGVTLDRDVEFAPANSPIERPVRVHVRSAAGDEREVQVTLDLPNGLVADSATRTVTLPAGAVRTMVFAVRGRLAPGRHAIKARVSSGGETFTSGYAAIDYEHIRPQRLYRPSAVALEAVDLKVPRGLTVAYIPGVGDNIAPMLEQLGLNVTVLDPASLPRTDLSRFGAVVVGTRAYEASDALVANNARLLEYAHGGGTLVVQYGQYEMQQAGIMPYPITLARPADRVTLENAPVKVLDLNAPVLNAPNRITDQDFAGWVQDRTLYMPRTFDRAYTPVLETNDPGEPPNRGPILIAQYGKGTYVYTTLAFFRQLPNGVPGAARLFVNLMAAKVPRTAQ